MNRVLISQAVGAFCHIKQDVTSWNYTEGAVVALDMTEYEREREYLMRREKNNGDKTKDNFNL